MSINGTSTPALNEKSPEQHTEDIKADLAKHGLEPVSQVEVTDPISGKKSIVTIDRTGTPESKLIIALADPNLKRDQKDHMLSMYLWERGKESASFITDIMRYKGQHTKETQAFKSQMRFDFETFVNFFCNFLESQAHATGKIMGVDIEEEIERYVEWLNLPNNKGKSFTYLDYMKSRVNYDKETMREGLILVVTSASIIYSAMQQLDEAKKLRAGVENVAKARMRDKGHGIYIDSSGKPYTFNDPELDDVIKADRERAAQVENEEV